MLGFGIVSDIPTIINIVRQKVFKTTQLSSIRAYGMGLNVYLNPSIVYSSHK